MIKENAYIKNGSISPENILFYKEFGYLVAPALLSIAEVDELKKETTAIFRGEEETSKACWPYKPTNPMQMY